jgi:ribosomal protein L12E/L44/L45/RPP1/RPP2
VRRDEISSLLIELAVALMDEVVVVLEIVDIAVILVRQRAVAGTVSESTRQLTHRMRRYRLFEEEEEDDEEEEEEEEGEDEEDEEEDDEGSTHEVIARWACASAPTRVSKGLLGLDRPVSCSCVPKTVYTSSRAWCRHRGEVMSNGVGLSSTGKQCAAARASRVTLFPSIDEGDESGDGGDGRRQRRSDRQRNMSRREEFTRAHCVLALFSSLACLSLARFELEPIWLKERAARPKDVVGMCFRVCAVCACVCVCVLKRERERERERES